MSKLCQQLPVELARVRIEKEKNGPNRDANAPPFGATLLFPPAPRRSFSRPIGADAGEGRDDARMSRVVSAPVDGRGRQGIL